MQLLLLNDAYRITSRFQPSCDTPIPLSPSCVRLPCRIELAVRKAMQSGTSDAPPDTAWCFIEPNLVIYVSRITGAHFSGLAVRAWFAAQITQLGDKRVRPSVL